MNTNNIQTGNILSTSTLIRVDSARLTKGRLRFLITSEEMEEAWAWTCKCIQVL